MDMWTNISIKLLEAKKGVVAEKSPVQNIHVMTVESIMLKRHTIAGTELLALVLLKHLMKTQRGRVTLHLYDLQ
jgi:sialic acid synthase SpsE